MKSFSSLIILLVCLVCLSDVSEAAPTESHQLRIEGNLDSGANTVLSSWIPFVCPVGSRTTNCSSTTYSDLNALANLSATARVLDSKHAEHTISIFFFKTGDNRWRVRAYVNNEETDPIVTTSGFPRLIGKALLTFRTNGQRRNAFSMSASDISSVFSWNNHSHKASIRIKFSPFTQFASASNISKIRVH